MATAPFNPAGGGNPSGYNNMSLQPTGGQSHPNPIISQWPGGVNMAPPGTTMGNPFPANGAPVGFGSSSNHNDPTFGGQFPNPFGAPSDSASWMKWRDATAKALSKQGGYGSAVGIDLANFIGLGGGFNPQALQMLFSALQPQVNRGEADILEHFGSMGIGMGSPAAIGMGDFLSQVNLNEGQMAVNMYEQSVQEMLSVLMGGNAKSIAGAGSSGMGIGALLGGGGQAAGGIASLLSTLGVGAASGGGGEAAAAAAIGLMA